MEKKKAPQAWGVEPAGAKRLPLPPPFFPPPSTNGTLELFPFSPFSNIEFIRYLPINSCLFRRNDIREARIYWNYLGILSSN